MALTLAVLVWLHARLDAMLDPGEFAILNPEAFDVGHRWYLNVSTAQWLCAIAFGVLSVWAWREEDWGTATATASRERLAAEESGS